MDSYSPRSHSKESCVKSVDHHTHKSPVTPLNLEEQKNNFLQHGILPTFTLNGTEEELELLKSKDKSKIRFDLLAEAENILNSVKARYGYGRDFLDKNYGPRITKDTATACLMDYLENNKLTGAMSIVWCKDLASSARMLWCGPSTKVNKPESRRYSFWLKDSPENAYLRKQGIMCLADHEIGTHFLRALNDGFQPWYSDRKRFGLNQHSSYNLLCTEEGLASIHATITSKEKYLWTPALLYYTACKSMEMTFKQLFDHLAIFIQDPEQRWKHVMRTKRLLPDVNHPGGYGKDQCYFEGSVSILRDLTNIDFEVLMSGRITKDEVSRVKRVARLNISTLPHFMHDIDQYRLMLHEIAMINGLLEPALPPHFVPRYHVWERNDVFLSSFESEMAKINIWRSDSVDAATITLSDISSKNELTPDDSGSSRDENENSVSVAVKTEVSSNSEKDESSETVKELRHGFSVDDFGRVKINKNGTTVALKKDMLELARKMGIVHSTTDGEVSNEKSRSHTGNESEETINESSFLEFITDDDITATETRDALDNVESVAVERSKSNINWCHGDNTMKTAKTTSESTGLKDLKCNPKLPSNKRQENPLLRNHGVRSKNDPKEKTAFKNFHPNVEQLKVSGSNLKMLAKTINVGRKETTTDNSDSNKRHKDCCRIMHSEGGRHVHRASRGRRKAKRFSNMKFYECDSGVSNDTMSAVELQMRQEEECLPDGETQRTAASLQEDDRFQENIMKEDAHESGKVEKNGQCNCAELLRGLLNCCISTLNRIHCIETNGSRFDIKNALVRLKKDCNEALTMCEGEQIEGRRLRFMTKHRCRKTASTQTQRRRQCSKHFQSRHRSCSRKVRVFDSAPLLYSPFRINDSTATKSDMSSNESKQTKRRRLKHHCSCKK